LAMQALYQLDVQGNNLLPHLGEFFADNEPNESSRRLASEWAESTWRNLGWCDELISSCTIRWEMARLAAVDKSILRLAVYQLQFCDDIPPRVVINEAIELAKKFGSDKSGSFVNGVLDAVLRRIRSGS